MPNGWANTIGTSTLHSLIILVFANAFLYAILLIFNSRVLWNPKINPHPQIPCHYCEHLHDMLFAVAEDTAALDFVSAVDSQHRCPGSESSSTIWWRRQVCSQSCPQYLSRICHYLKHKQMSLSFCLYHQNNDMIYVFWQNIAIWIELLTACG